MNNSPNSNNLIAVAFYCCSLIVNSAHAQDREPPAGITYETHVAPGIDPLVAECGFKLWIPDGTPVVRSIFVINRRGAGGHLFFRDTEWRAMAARNGAAMMLCEFEAAGVRANGYGRSMLTACDQFAVALKRPGLKHAPFILWGHSMGGRVAQDFVRFDPSRVLAFHIGLRANPSSEEFMMEEPAATKIPGLYLMGELDSTPADMRDHFARARKNNSPRAWVRLPGQAHWPAGMKSRNDRPASDAWRAWIANDVLIPWTEAMIRLRLPEDADPREGPVDLLEPDVAHGWLGDIATGQSYPYGTFKGDKSEASWFPNGKVARVWEKFSFPESDQHDGTTNETVSESTEARQ